MAFDEKKREKGLGMVRGMKVLYIAKRGPNNIAAKTHLSVIKAIYGADNVIEIDLLKAFPEHKDRYIAYGYKTRVNVLYVFCRGILRLSAIKSLVTCVLLFEKIKFHWYSVKSLIWETFTKKSKILSKM